MLTRALADIMNMGHEVVLVSSGAVGVGVGKMGLEKKPTSTREKQALAAIGQAGLVSMYDKFFKEYGYNTGQVLLTKFILDEEMRYRSAKRAFETMIKYNVIPIVNENDVISSYEIEFGDNDTLSAYVAELVDADLLVLMSDIDGFYTDNPNTNPDARLISVPRTSSMASPGAPRTPVIRALSGLSAICSPKRDNIKFNANITAPPKAQVSISLNSQINGLLNNMHIKTIRNNPNM